MAELNALVVEDSTAMRQLIVFALRRVPGLKTAEALNGVEALKAIQGTKFDIIITDINMPIMDGLKLIGHVRKDPAHKDIPIVIITTEGADEDRQRAMALGAARYITKPVQANHVTETVKELLKI
ncbi:MAG: response regulator [Clostridia bacterium]|nr:response regulator [Deltaproteobacteria bacterium]